MLADRALHAAFVGLVALGVSLSGCRRSEDPEPRPAVSLLDRRPHVATESRFLTFGAGDRRHLGSGWHGDERNVELDRHFVWAHGRRATVTLRILQVVDQQVLIELSPIFAERPTPIEVSANGTRIATIRPVPGFREYRFLVPAKALRRGQNRLVFDHAVVGPPPRHLAAGYSWILLGPECLRLRPKGHPPEPPRVRAADGTLHVRGPAELTWTLTPPAEARLHLRAEVGEDPVRFALEVRDGEGWHPAGEARLSPPWIGESTVRGASFDLAAWSGLAVALRIRVLPEPCRSPFTEARLVEISVAGKTIDKPSDLSR